MICPLKSGVRRSSFQRFVRLDENMSSEKGWFESEDEYQARISKEADERTIETSTGSSPAKGWFESDDDYRERISQEANERRIEDSTGSSPSKGWFESDGDYRDRVHREANERAVNDSTGTSPSKGWFESDEDYDTRVRKEANEAVIEADTNLAPKKGWFEDDHEYRSRIAHEARMTRAKESSNSNYHRGLEGSSGASYTHGRSSSSRTKSSNGAFWISAFIAGIILTWFLSNDDNAEVATSLPVRSQAEIAEEQQRLMEERRQAQEAILQTYNFGQWNAGQTLELQTRPFSFCTRPCGSGATGPASIRLLSITKTSSTVISLRFSIRTSAKNQYRPGFLENRADNDYLLFVKSDSYTELGFGASAVKSLYAEAMHLIDGQGKKYKSLSGIEGVHTTAFNNHAFSASLPFDSEVFFNVLLPLPATTTNLLRFVSPALHGHQGQWYWTIYDFSQI